MKKVLHIAFSDTGGGAAIAAMRHCEAMRRCGIDAKILLASRNKEYNYSYSIIKNCKFSSLYLFLIQAYSYLMQKMIKSSFYFSFPLFTYHIHKNPLVCKADIIYIHWVASSMLSTNEIKRLAEIGKPIRWYMHDMNPVTGGCHHSMECLKYTKGCKDCPQIRKILGLDLANIQYRKRIKCLSHYMNIELYSPSKWLAHCAEESGLWKNHLIRVFPNVIDTHKFKPVNKSFSKGFFGLDSRKKTILFGAADVYSYYKGWRYLQEALNQLNSAQYECLIFGNDSCEIKASIQINAVFTGYLNDEYSLILAYNAADVFVIPSLAENYPNVVMEAMSCGLPSVGFNIGGIPEQISHLKNGYVAEYKNSTDLSKGIRWVCEEANYDGLSKNARKFVVEIADYNRYSEMES